MTIDQNPFLYDAAGTLDEDQVLDYYIDDYNWSRLIQSKRNVFLVGERGSGKSMTLIFNSSRVQLRRAQRNAEAPSLEYIGVLVPCNTPLTFKREYKVLDDLRASVVSEHFFSLFIAYQIATALDGIPNVLEGGDEEALRKELEFTLGLEIPAGMPIFRALQLTLDRESIISQRRINEPNSSLFDEEALSFSSLVVALLHAVRRVPQLSKSHFMLMIDDAQDLNEHQIRTLNSWIAFRDRSLFSLKVATAKIGQPSRITASGGSILESHDYITIDMERSLHNEDSTFGHLAKRIIEKRLERVGAKVQAEEFFPEHPGFIQDLREAGERVRREALAQFTDADEKKIGDYVYKQRRPEYFRSRAANANLPVYSGFSTLVYLSTGVVRNLLEPCWWMFDAMLSEVRNSSQEPKAILEIPPTIQSQVIHERSKAAWAQLRELDQTIEGCSAALAERVFNLFDQLAIYFHYRLMNHKSEPGAISFSISERVPEAMRELTPLLEIAQRAQMLYVREGPAKDRAKRELYYVPNRILWPVRGLDPHGQHARASIKATTLVRASQGKPIKNVEVASQDAPVVVQPDLFSE